MGCNPLYQQSVISMADFSKEQLMYVVLRTLKLKTQASKPLLTGQLIASCFFEASTRTRLSFEAAILSLNAQLIGFDDSKTTSLGQKGETLADSCRVIGQYADALIIRHPCEGAARLASECTQIPVINAGDGANQHPTQTFLDLVSIFETQQRLDDLNIALVGDLKYGRTVHSLVQALSLFGCSFYFVSPKDLMIPDAILQEITQRGCCYTCDEKLSPEWTGSLDILYMTRFQAERFDATELSYLENNFRLSPELLMGAKANLKILHPLPRREEIDLSVDATPYAYYFQQAQNGMYTRQALLCSILSEPELY